jgi:hypothetical protein
LMMVTALFGLRINLRHLVGGPGVDAPAR